MYREGDLVYGTITNILGYGAFVEIDKNYTGLVHISEFSDGYVRNIRDFVQIGEKVKLRVIEVDEENKNAEIVFDKISFIL